FSRDWARLRLTLLSRLKPLPRIPGLRQAAVVDTLPPVTGVPHAVAAHSSPHSAGPAWFCRQFPAVPGGAEKRRAGPRHLYQRAPAVRRPDALAGGPSRAAPARRQLAFRAGAVRLCRGLFLRLCATGYRHWSVAAVR